METEHENTDEGKEQEAVQARVTELEQSLSEKDSEIETLKKLNEELGKSLSGAVENYRTLVIQANTGIPEELVTGDTVQAVNESLGKAKALVSKVRQGVEAEITRTKVPAGAPERGAADLSALSPAEKIRIGLGGNE